MSDISAPDSPVIPAPATPAAGVPELAYAPEPPGASPETLAANDRFAVRTWCTFIFLICASMMGVALWLTPSAEGTGTHRELGLPPCGFLEATGYPCPTCGCTTAVSYFAHGHLLASLLTQPFGFGVALIATLLLPFTLIGMIRGKWVGPSTFVLGWYWHSWVFGGVGLLLVGWLYKIMIVRAHITF